MYTCSWLAVTMGEELLWAVKNGDVEAAKKRLENVSPHTRAEGGLL